MNKKFIYVFGAIILLLILITFGGKNINISFSDVIFSYSNNQSLFADSLVGNITSNIDGEGADWSIPNIIRNIVKGR